MEENILNISCPACGAPAKFDIIDQIYRCHYCGGNVSVENVRIEKGNINRQASMQGAEDYDLEVTSCSGCGAQIIFEKDEALSTCEFCGRSLVRKRYVNDLEIPYYVIPFGVTPDEAEEKLLEWCDKNKSKSESEHLRAKIRELRGYYLPYEMVQGPVHCKVGKSSESTKFDGHGYLNGEFINCSKQLDNLVLDAMEPFNLDNLKEFDFAYVAGHRVKISDIDTATVTKRLNEEAEANYRPCMEKLWGTKAIDIKTTVDDIIRFPVLLPVYYINDGNVKAAVNGQTGKVSVLAEKPSSYFTVPWWLKGILVIIAALGATFGVSWLRGMPVQEGLLYTGVLGVFYLIIFLCMFQDGGSTEFGFRHYRQIFNSGEQVYHREEGRLVLSSEVIKRRIAEPVFMHELEGRMTPVSYSFGSFKRFAITVVLSVVTIFLPIIIALFINGFDFEKLTLGGSAVWLFIAVPVVPIYLIRFGIQWLYDNPWIYVFKENGKRKRYRKKIHINRKTVLAGLKYTLTALLVPPICLITWAIIGSMGIMVYLTAFGFD